MAWLGVKEPDISQHRGCRVPGGMKVIVKEPELSVILEGATSCMAVSLDWDGLGMSWEWLILGKRPYFGGYMIVQESSRGGVPGEREFTGHGLAGRGLAGRGLAGRGLAGRGRDERGWVGNVPPSRAASGAEPESRLRPRGLGWMQILVLLALMPLFYACAPASYVVLLESPEGAPPGQVVVRSPDGREAQLTEAGGALALAADGARPVTISASQFERHFSDTQAVQPLPAEVFLLYFEIGGTALTGESIALMPSVLQTVSQRPVPDISVTGHTDTVGEATVNERLARERAEYVAAWLRSANPEVVAITVASHGQRNLLIPTADGVAEPRNRRVEITVR